MKWGSSFFILPSYFCLATAVFLEGVGNVFEEDEAEDDVLVLPRFARPAGSLRLAISASLRFRRVHIVTELVGGEPSVALRAPQYRCALRVCATAHSGGLEAEVGGGIFG